MDHQFALSISHKLLFYPGRHRCIGESFAYVQLKSILARLVLDYEFSLTAERGFPVCDYTSMVVMPEKPVRIAWKRRGAVREE